MAVSVPASPSVSSYFDTELPDHQSKLFQGDSMSIGLYTTFGEDDSNSSFGSWPDPYSCSEVSSFPQAADSFTSLLNYPRVAAAAEPSQPQLVLPTTEDLNLDVRGTSSEFLQHGCHSNNTPAMHSNFEDTVKSMATPDSSVDEYIAEANLFSPQQLEEVAQENHFSPQQLEDEVAEMKSHYAGAAPQRAPQLRFISNCKDSTRGGSLKAVSRSAPELHSFKGHEKDSPEESRSEYNFDGRTNVELPDCFQVSNDDDGSVTTTSLEQEEPEEADGVHIPPPLNMKRIEMYDDAYYESIEAAEVPLDVIENKRPFQCGLAGCNKTFKNPQTMKMHHKTTFTDGSASAPDALLPTLTSSATTAWMSGRNKKIPSRCPKCRKTFVGLYELRRHYGRKHSEGERPYQCRKCDKRFYIEVDVRDHEKLCGEQIECKCGLKFAFKCNMVAHKKAHPECQDLIQPNQNSTSVTINADSNNSSTSNNSNTSNTSNYTSNTSGHRTLDVLTTQSTVSDEDSSVSRWISPRTSPSLRPPRTKRCHELVEETRPDLMSKHMKVSSRRTAPAQNFWGLGQVEDATSFTAAGYDFPGFGFGTDGISLWPSSNMHYPSVPSLPIPVPGSVPGPVRSVLGGWEHLGTQIQQTQRRSGPSERLSALDLLQLAGVTPGL